MNMEECANFTASSTNDPCSPNDSRIVNLFQKFDENKDGLLSL